MIRSFKSRDTARLNDNGAYPYLRSHPMTTERIADAQEDEIAAQSDAERQKAAERVDDLKLVRAVF